MYKRVRGAWEREKNFISEQRRVRVGTKKKSPSIGGFQCFVSELLYLDGGQQKDVAHLIRLFCSSGVYVVQMEGAMTR
jgi:hypothetical protein